VTPDDHFRIASLTKTYTATVVLRLVAAHELGLSDTVGRWLPGVLPAGKRRITVRQLLAHTSGLYDSMNDAARAFLADRRAFLATIHDPALRRRVVALAERLARDPETVLPAGIWVEIAAAEPLYFPPGSSYHYSNTNYILLGWIVEKATGKPLGQVMEEQVFAPLRLDHTVYEPGAGLPKPFARSYSLPASGRGKPTDQSRITGGVAGGSAVVATAEDVARFYTALLAGELVPRSLLDGVMLRERLGIFDDPARCGRTYGHNGSLASYLSYARVSADGGSAAVLLLNGLGPTTEARGDAAIAALSCGGASAALSMPATQAA
jgi:D-alanyl-D-alanine carboxypeptidase